MGEISEWTASTITYTESRVSGPNYIFRDIYFAITTFTPTKFNIA